MGSSRFHARTATRNSDRPLRLVAFFFASACDDGDDAHQTLLDDLRVSTEDGPFVGDREEPTGRSGGRHVSGADGTGTLRVVSESGGAPRVGAHTGRGTFRSAFHARFAELGRVAGKTSLHAVRADQIRAWYVYSS